MSRCKACDVILTEAELRKRDRVTDEHLDLCAVCHSASDEAIEENWATAEERAIIRSNN
jgi:urease alpha subunit|tara:strand:+ start:392 stop:568 length:177 start_codon:yes stop_codon:yes gene_type:complete